MTHKYLEVRCAIYEKCPDKSYKKYRTFGEMKKLFKVRNWIFVIILAICLIACILLPILRPSTFYYFIPAGILFLIIIISEFYGENLYNSSEREKELSEISKDYNDYITYIKSVLKEHEIINEKQREALKKECTDILMSHYQKYNSVKSKVYNMLIGVPLGAFISTLIYKDGNTVINQIVGIILVGLVILAISNVIRMVSYYSDGRFKDQHLLNVLNELEYFEQ